MGSVTAARVTAPTLLDVIPFVPAAPSRRTRPPDDQVLLRPSAGSGPHGPRLQGWFAGRHGRRG
jgi:hypothetical protein